jgi:hypothetical protein
MKHAKYFPRTIGKQRQWAHNYKDEIANNGAAFGMTANEIAEEQGFCNSIMEAIDAAQSAKAEAKAKNKAKDLVISKNMDKLRSKIRMHKTNSAYNASIGKALGIIGSEIVFDSSNVKTKVKLRKTPAGISISFNLKLCEGGNVYCKRGNQDDFTFLKHVNHPKMVDARPNENGVASELMQYFVILVIKDEEVGKPSDIASINN